MPEDKPIAQLVRTFRNGRQLGVGYSTNPPPAFFVFDRDRDGDPWHMHCGPYGTFDEGKWWIESIRDDNA